MGAKKTLAFLFMVVAIGLLVIYWFFPFSNFEDAKVQNTIQTNNFTGNPNFSYTNESKSLQFYPNLRYKHEDVHYYINSSCPLEKKDEMLRAMNILENKTVLNFYNSEDPEYKKYNPNTEILISCQNKNIERAGVFVAGEGGPVEIVKSGMFNVIKRGEVLLIRETRCAGPNIALHELLHALGFDHSDNPKNIMFGTMKCYQEMGNEIPKEIDRIYSYESLPDLTFEEVSSSTHGRYLDFNVSVRNIGLESSKNSTIKVYANNKSVKEISLGSLEPGEGTKYMSKNLLIKQLKLEELKFEIDSPGQELNKTNNEIILR